MKNEELILITNDDGFKSKGIKVLVMADPIDQFWLSMAGQFKEKNFVSITQGEIDLDNIKSDKKILKGCKISFVVLIL